MHEMALCESILDAIEGAAAREGFARVTAVRLEIGRFAGVETDALRFGFDVVTRGSVAEGAALIVIDQPGIGACFDCGAVSEIDDRLAPCPACGSARLAPSGGDALRIKDLEVV